MTVSERDMLSSLHQSYLDTYVLYTAFRKKMGAFVGEMGYQEAEAIEKGGVFRVARGKKGQWKRAVFGMRKRGLFEVFFGSINGLLMEGVEAEEADMAEVTAECLKVEENHNELRVEESDDAHV